jgi:hypothetical protein
VKLSMPAVDGRLRGHDEKGREMGQATAIRSNKIERGFLRLGLIGAVAAVVIAAGLLIGGAVVFAQGNQAWEYWDYVDTSTNRSIARTPENQVMIAELERRGTINSVWHPGSASDALIYLGGATFSLFLGGICFGIMWAIGWVLSGFVE